MPSTIFMKAPAAKPPQIQTEISHPQFRKFRMDWNIFKQITNIPPSQIHAQLYGSCTDTVPTSLVNTVTIFFDLNATQLLQTLEQIVTKKSNPTVHQLHFSSLHQSETEPIQEFVVGWKSIVPDCKFTCSNCQHDIQEQHIRDQLIRGLFNKTLQTDILAKASHLKSLEDIIIHAEAFEVAQCHHTYNNCQKYKLSDRLHHIENKKLPHIKASSKTQD